MPLSGYNAKWFLMSGLECITVFFATVSTGKIRNVVDTSTENILGSQRHNGISKVGMGNMSEIFESTNIPHPDACVCHSKPISKVKFPRKKKEYNKTRKKEMSTEFTLSLLPYIVLYLVGAKEKRFLE